VPWRFSDAGQHRAHLNRCDAASDKPAQERTLRLMRHDRSMIWRRIGGLLAWQAHLGGWIAGWLLAGVIRPRQGPLETF